MSFALEIDELYHNLPVAFKMTPLSKTGPIVKTPGSGRSTTTKTQLIDFGESVDSLNHLLKDYRLLKSRDDNDPDWFESRANVDEWEAMVAEDFLDNPDVDSDPQLPAHHAIAWYQSFHFADQKGRWGITVHADRFHSYVQFAIRSNTHRLNPGYVLLLCLLNVYRHELFHFISDIYAMRIEQGIVRHLPKKPGPRQRGIYRRYTTRVKSKVKDSDADLEEALATSYSYSRLARDIAPLDPENCLPKQLALGYRRYDEFKESADFSRGVDELGSMISNAALNELVVPTKFQSRPTKSQLHALGTIRVVGSDRATMGLAGLFGQAFVTARKFEVCLKQFGLSIEQRRRGRSPHPRSIVYRGTGSQTREAKPIRPVPVKVFGDRVNIGLRDKLRIILGTLIRILRLRTLRRV